MTWSENHFTFLYLTLKPLCLISRTSWCYFRKLWTVSRSDWGTILIHAFNHYWIWFAYKLLVWSEGYSSIWCNRVSSLSWNHFFLASIFEGWLDCFIDRNQWVATLEGWGTCLRNTLRACASCTSSCRRYLSEFWTVSRSYWSTILIHTFHGDWIWISNKLFIWSESHSSVWCNSVSSLTWNRFLFASIFEGWLNCFIDRNQWIATFKCWGTSLRDTLRTCARCVSSCWCDLGYCWCISCGDFSTVLIYTFHGDWIWSTNILFVWRKGNRAIWIDAVFTYTRNSLR